ncbi:Protein CBG10241 [Caenorhabditis briggsae]|uniref:Protein CBG10241 n=1 Tax=Caenorhabditis briggsae TaxID=6238 RepID=A8XAS3_CAEBR|nr:Protein CBG10241 [Caenorhabditis briggsae]CAP29738.1 Protein CBG10241 [Caenorhabditis briggsae]
MSSFFGWFSLNKDSSVEILRKTPQYTPIEIVKTGTHHKEILCNEKFNFERAIAKVFHGKAGKKEYTKELELLTNLQHKNIINFLSQSTVDGYHILVFRNLMKISERIEMRILFPPGSVQSLFKDLLTGLQFLHGKNYCHRLIMPENLLYTGNGVLKITGLSNVSPIKDSKNREILLNGLIGEGMYSAPECFSEVSYSGTEADIYSAGLTLYAMIVLYNPLPTDQPLHKRVLEVIQDARKIDALGTNVLVDTILHDPSLRKPISILLKYRFLTTRLQSAMPELLQKKKFI